MQQEQVFHAVLEIPFSATASLPSRVLPACSSEIVGRTLEALAAAAAAAFASSKSARRSRERLRCDTRGRRDHAQEPHGTELGYTCNDTAKDTREAHETAWLGGATYGASTRGVDVEIGSTPA
eukprot:scaffold269_cov229-Pinguiococcus_pyrenoidosus.AAC.13